MLNRRGHIATWMVLIGAIALVTVTIFSFVNFEGNFEKRNYGISKTYLDFSDDITYVKNIFPLLVSRTVRDFDGKEISIDEFKENFETRATKLNEFYTLDLLKYELYELNTAPDSDFFVKIIRDKDYDVSSEGNGVYNISINNIRVSSGKEDNEIVSYFNLSVRFDSNGLVS